MKHITAPLFLLALISLLAPQPASAITIDTVPVGNVGNAGDPAIDGLAGAVAYAYSIGKYEVTNAEYAAFLNEKAKSDPLALYNSSMGSNARGGISRSGSSPNFSYAVKTDMGDKPVNFVSWYDSIRFANWLNNGQGSGDTESGAYTLLGGTPTPSNGSSITRNTGAKWVLTSFDEWYKGAFHHPAAQGGDSDDYWNYPTASNSEPTIATANSVGDISNPGPNVANYGSGADWNSQDGNVTTVGSAGPASASFYGTFDQGGNVFEWTESLYDSSRLVRGGSWRDSIFGSSYFLDASGGLFQSPTTSDNETGFRVASVPEPTTLALAAPAVAFGVAIAVRRKRDRVASH